MIAEIEPAIERAEMDRAFLMPPENLNAWEMYHRGLWHSFRFTRKDNEAAHALFRKAAALDPRFSRAYAGLSFTHYSRAFLNSVPGIGDEIAKGFIGIHADDTRPVLASLEMAQRLSPFDPLLFAIKSSRAMSLVFEGKLEEAAAWSVRATNEPNAHFHIYAIAAGCLELAGRSEDAGNNAEWALARHPGYSTTVFRRSFPHSDELRRQPLIEAMHRAGIPAET